MTEKIKLKTLDVVMTKFKTVSVVDRVSADGKVSIVLPPNSQQKVAWYDPSELTYLGKLSEMIMEVEV
jgi:hypothetical protein